MTAADMNFITLVVIGILLAVLGVAMFFLYRETEADFPPTHHHHPHAHD